MSKKTIKEIINDKQNEWDKITIEELESKRKELKSQAYCYLQGAEDDKAMGCDDWDVSRQVANSLFRESKAIKRYLKRLT